MNNKNELETPLLGGDLGVGKSIIREIFTEISRPRNPPLTPPKRGIVESPPPKRGIICAIIKYVADIIVNDTIILELSCLSCRPVKS